MCVLRGMYVCMFMYVLCMCLRMSVEVFPSGSLSSAKVQRVCYISHLMRRALFLLPCQGRSQLLRSAAIRLHKFGPPSIVLNEKDSICKLQSSGTHTCSTLTPYLDATSEGAAHLTLTESRPVSLLHSTHTHCVSGLYMSGHTQCIRMHSQPP